MPEIGLEEIGADSVVIAVDRQQRARPERRNALEQPANDRADGFVGGVLLAPQHGEIVAQRDDCVGADGL